MGFCVVTILTVLSIGSFLLGNAVIFAQQTIKCPSEQIPVLKITLQLLIMPQVNLNVAQVTGLDPLGSIFGRQVF